MDTQCSNFEPPHLDTSIELLSEVRQPSFSSLNDSLSSSPNLSQNIKEESFSDSEAVHSMLTSTPQRNSMQRRSVSLVDVSKIDMYSSRPLSSSVMASWETIGSQSSVGKSRDSGFLHSASLLSFNSAKLSELRSDPANLSIVKEYMKLKKELEYNEVLINTLQESNTQLRRKCADANNRIFELRLQCENRCDCCTKVDSNAVINPKTSTDTFSIISSNSSPERSRSSSPEFRFHSYNDLPASIIQSPLSKVEEEGVSFDEGEANPVKPWPTIDNNTCAQINNSYMISQKPTEPILVQNVAQSNADYSFLLTMNSDNSLNDSFFEMLDRNMLSQSNKCCENTTEKNGTSKQVINEERNDAKDLNVCLTDECKLDGKEKTFITDSGFEEKLKHQTLSQTSVIDELFDDETRNNTSSSDEVPFIARKDKNNGKILVGSFKAWGDSSIRVTPVSRLSPSSSSDRIKIASSSFEKITKTAGCSNYFDSNATPPTIKSMRPISIYTSSPYCLETSKSSDAIYPSSSLYNQVKDTVQIPQIKVPRSVNHHYRKSQNSPTTFHTLKVHKPDSNLNALNARNTEIKLDSYCTPKKSSSTNLSNLGVSVTQKVNKTINPELVLGGWNDLRSKLSSLISSRSKSEASSEPSKSSVCKNMNSSKSVLKTSETDGCTKSSHLVNDFSKSNTNSPESQSIEECLERANEYARLMSQGLSKLPQRLEYIQSIGRIET